MAGTVSVNHLVGLEKDRSGVDVYIFENFAAAAGRDRKVLAPEFLRQRRWEKFIIGFADKIVAIK